MKPKFPSFLLIPALVLALSCQHQPDQNSAKNSVAVICVPVTSDKDWYTSGTKAPLFEGLEGISFPVTTAVPEAERYFLQGLMLAYGFNHAEAARSFYEGTRQDPGCAICYWGYAYVLGPNYNGGMESDNFQRAYEASRKAVSLKEKCNEKERVLIEALSKRYAEDPPEDRSELDKAYANAMREAWREFPDDPDIAALCAESLLDLHPWDLWLKDGTPQPWTKEILEVLETALAGYPDHAGANHYYIHAVEASAEPELGLASAQTLEDLVPGAAHLLHMPSHIYINTGDYHAGSLANLRAVACDSSYVDACHAQGVYPLAYYPHNYHFLAATATLEGNQQIAMMASYKVSGLTNTTLMKDPDWATIQHYYLIPYHVAVKFGRWDEILDMPLEDPELPYVQCVRHYARGMACLGKGSIDSAERELKALEDLMGDPVLREMTVWEINPVITLVEISRDVLGGEIEFKKGNPDKSIELFYQAVELEDGLNYDEPPDWFFSVRHHLGAVLIETGKYAEAEIIFLDDLAHFPKNGWAMKGLQLAYEGEGKEAEAQEAALKFQEYWKWSDTPIETSRIM